MAEPKTVPEKTPRITSVNDDELARLRSLFAEEPPTLGALRGIGRVIEPLYDDILREKKAKHWSWKHVADRLTAWGYPTSPNYLAKVFAQIEQRRAATSRTRAGRPAAKGAALSVRRTGPALGEKRTELVAHALAEKLAEGESVTTSESAAATSKKTRSASVTPLRPFAGAESARIVKRL